MLASPKTRWRLRIHAGSVTVVDEQANASEPQPAFAGLDGTIRFGLAVRLRMITRQDDQTEAKGQP